MQPIISAGNSGFDVIVPSDYMVTIMVEESLLADIQRDAVPNLANLDAVFADPAYDPGGGYSVAYQWGTTGLGVDLSVVGDDFEASWALVRIPPWTRTTSPSSEISTVVGMAIPPKLR